MFKAPILGGTIPACEPRKIRRPIKEITINSFPGFLLRITAERIMGDIMDVPVKLTRASKAS